MANERFTSKLINRLKNMELTEADASRRREQAATGRNIYRDRREVRSIFYRMRMWRLRARFFAVGVFLGLLIHEVTGIGLLSSVGACAVCSTLVFESHMQRKRQRERHLD
ncbi:hypothetical protein [Ciceribacter ferrooxidans]|uniref:Uncharacterized protein n=1 Tax=Ciceribacter ferrooxidans TaxID=2509717 RepID=A0A4Q2TE54_9HYPH|nr:hypothetical protein [Ciceribacter ferrooxidans]RYC15280.1 hypothetical protein EUU22_09605 [Ciceribacter ferrooxidans]